MNNDRLEYAIKLLEETRDRLMTRAAVVPTVELQGDVLIISSRPVALAQSSRSESPQPKN